MAIPLPQIRQRVESKRTLFLIEQLILARQLQRRVLDVELVRDGMDLYFADKVGVCIAMMTYNRLLQHRSLSTDSTIINILFCLTCTTTEVLTTTNLPLILTHPPSTTT